VKLHLGIGGQKRLHTAALGYLRGKSRDGVKSRDWGPPIMAFQYRPPSTPCLRQSSCGFYPLRASSQNVACSCVQSITSSAAQLRAGESRKLLTVNGQDFVLGASASDIKFASRAKLTT
jgi:hypothetical protein